MKRITAIIAATLICFALFAQQANQNTATASILKHHLTITELNSINTFTPPATAAASYRSPKQKAGIALLVIGPANMLVGLGLLGYSVGYARASSDIPANDRRVGLYAGFGAFHLLTGAALTAGGAVLIHKGRQEGAQNYYMKLPEPVIQTRGTGTGIGVQTGFVF